MPDNFMRSIKEIFKVGSRIRNNFEFNSILASQLVRLYQDYNPIEDINLFIDRARVFFPRLNCGIASLVLRDALGGKIVNGKYSRHNHTFLLLDDNTLVDITSDQYGGPKVYAGELKEPWSLI